jgi:hypothetical protein
MPPSSSALPPEQGLEHVFVESCRKCSFEYKFKLRNGKPVIVLCGRPDRGVGKYKALSYVWEDTTNVLLKCHKCLESTEVQMRDASKLRAIMEFLRGGSRVWIDALSIDQSDPKDKAVQLPVMGDIYRHAEVVSVFLLEADSEAYEMLKRLSIVYAEIVKRYDAFAAGQTTENLSHLADDFSANVRAWMGSLYQWRYWRRAWTFQEWAMAREIEISYENAPGNEGLANIKKVIVEASTILGHWRKMTAKGTASGTTLKMLLKDVHLRDDIGLELNVVRSLFPFEEFLVADSNEEMENLRSSTFLTPMPIATDSGTYIGPAGTSPPFRSTLGLALNAMRQASGRQPTKQIS